MHDIIVANMISTERDRLAEANAHPDAPLPFETAIRDFIARFTQRSRQEEEKPIESARQACADCACQTAR